MPHTSSATPALLESSVQRSVWFSRWVLVPLGIYTLFRLAGAAMLVWATQFQEATRRLDPAVDPRTDYFVHSTTPADPGLLGVSTTWDGQWYWSIAELGYRSVAEDSSIAAQWAWAFPPGYPKTVAAVMHVSGLSFPAAAVMVSLIAGAVASVLLYRLAQYYVGPLGAAGLVAVTNSFVTAPLLQVAYSESLALVLLLWAMLAIRRQSYWWAVVPVVLLSLTRLITPPLAAVAVASAVYRWRSTTARPSKWEALSIAVLATTCLFSAFAWPTVANGLAGSPIAGRLQVSFQRAPLGWFGALQRDAPVLLPFLVLIVAALMLLAWRNRHFWGIEMATWAVSYPLFVLTVASISAGILRYLLLAFPLGLMLIGTAKSTTRTRVSLIGVVCLLGILAQAWWIRHALLADVTGGRPLIP